MPAQGLLAIVAQSGETGKFLSLCSSFPPIRQMPDPRCDTVLILAWVSGDGGSGGGEGSGQGGSWGESHPIRGRGMPPCTEV